MSDGALLKRQSLRMEGAARPSRLAPAAPALKSTAGQDKVLPVGRETLTDGRAVSSVTDIERLKEAARQEGLALGRKQGKEAVEQAARDQLAALKAMVAQVGAAWELERERMQAHLADFAFVSVNRLLGDCLHDPAAAIAAVRSAMLACEGWQTLTIEVHRNELALYGDLISANPPASPRSLKIVASDDVALGGCRVVSDVGTLDARLETQLTELRARLDAHRAAFASKKLP